MLPATVSFPMGAACAAQISMPVFCAATSAAAFKIQEGDAGGVKEIYEHIGVPPEYYGEATRQMHAAWSASRRFKKPSDVAYAISPTEEMVDEVIGKLGSVGLEETGPSSQGGLDEVSLAAIDAAMADGDPSEIADCLKYVAVTSLYVGDIATAVAAMEMTWEFLPNNVLEFEPFDHMQLAACWAMLGDSEKAIDHVNLVYTRFAGSFLPEDRVHRLAAETYIEMGSPERAARAAGSIENLSVRFFAKMSIADGLKKLRDMNEAEAYFMNECFETAKSASEFKVRIYQLQRVVEELMKNGMNESAKRVMDEIIDPSRNLDGMKAKTEFAMDSMEWAAKTMKDLGYSLERIIEFLTRGRLDEGHPSFTSDPTGLELRRAQADIVLHRWSEELDDIAREWAAAE